ncbi:MAG: type II toxin-antitoxin system VapC family toxin [Ilumatobacter sp.]|uniref:type II toxin-antitoxin system VapC family toxin n=1 Tax=Ilumatobacter sp. TaxID=1967498 RepID=UPI00263119E0|nr:type II toxin-antitoxin system VapC family toxin [Ilumatobacter sp.]MDJ0768913.1 type II toxin-antitoxin system VapC family toxin [Ilumatobacter sp.]
MAVGTLVDSNVLLDVMTEDERWADWSVSALATAAELGPLVINPVIFSEVSIRFSRVEQLDEALPASDFRRAAIPWSAAFLAGKAFARYRRRRGTMSSTLPDFFIGAHAAVDDLALLTRDARRYRSYFPTVELWAP